jgi:hypothetical protein
MRDPILVTTATKQPAAHNTVATNANPSDRSFANQLSEQLAASRVDRSTPTSAETTGSTANSSSDKNETKDKSEIDNELAPAQQFASTDTPAPTATTPNQPVPPSSDSILSSAQLTEPNRLGEEPTTNSDPVYPGPTSSISAPFESPVANSPTTGFTTRAESNITTAASAEPAFNANPSNVDSAKRTSARDKNSSLSRKFL